MSEPFVGEIRMFAGNFAPAGWAFCDGSLLAISENSTLFTLIGTTYGGDGQQTFGLPDLRGRIPVHQGNGFVQGELTGIESVTLSVSQLATHTHIRVGSTGAANSRTPNGLAPAVSTHAVYGTAAPAPLASTALSAMGSGFSHDNSQPFVCIGFILSLFGVYPSQN